MVAQIGRFLKGLERIYQVAWYHRNDMQHEVSEHELVGGAKLLAVDTPGAISFYFSSHVRNGHRFCDPKIYEVPHLLEHLVFEGNTRYPEPIEFKSAVERLGAAYNASTGFNQTRYYFVAGTDFREEIVELGLDQLLTPLIDPVRVGQQKQVIDQELRRRLDNDRGNRSYRHNHTLFPVMNLDWEERIKRLARITPEDVREYWEHTYVTSNLRFVVAGDLGAGRLAVMLKQLNRRLKTHPTGTPFKYEPLKSGRYHRKVTAFPSHIPSQDHFYLTFTELGRDEEAVAALMLLNCVYDGGLASRMKMKSREQGLTYTFNSGYSSGFDSTELWMADQTAPDKLYDLVKLGVTELRGTLTGTISDAEMERARGLIVGSLQRSFQTPAALASWYDYRFLFDLPRLSPDGWIEQARAVDRDAIRKAGQKYVTPDNWSLTLIGQGLDSQTDRYKKLLISAFS